MKRSVCHLLRDKNRTKFQHLTTTQEWARAWINQLKRLTPNNSRKWKLWKLFSTREILRRQTTYRTRKGMLITASPCNSTTKANQSHSRLKVSLPTSSRITPSQIPSLVVNAALLLFKVSPKSVSSRMWMSAKTVRRLHRLWKTLKKHTTFMLVISRLGRFQIKREATLSAPTAWIIQPRLKGSKVLNNNRSNPLRRKQRQPHITQRTPPRGRMQQVYPRLTRHKTDIFEPIQLEVFLKVAVSWSFHSFNSLILS